MPAEPLCTLQQVKTYLGITDTSSDALITQLIPAVTAEILNAICRLDLMPGTDYDEWICGNGQCRLYLKHYPITQVTAVTVNGEDLPEWDGYTNTASGWVFKLDPNPENQQFIRMIGICFDQLYQPYYADLFWPYPNYWPQCCVPNVHIQYKAGYDEVPPALQQAAIDFVAFRRTMSMIQGANPLLTERHMGDYSEQVGGPRGLIVDLMGVAMPASVATVIEQYQRLVV